MLRNSFSPPRWRRRGCQSELVVDVFLLYRTSLYPHRIGEVRRFQDVCFYPFAILYPVLRLSFLPRQSFVAISLSLSLSLWFQHCRHQSRSYHHERTSSHLTRLALFVELRLLMGNKSSRKGKRDPTILSEDDLKFLQTNTQYSEEEIDAWHAGFLKDCPSGQLDKKQFLSLYRVGASITYQSFFLSASINRDSIRMANQINTVISSSKPSTRIIITGSILRNSCKRETDDDLDVLSVIRNV